MWHRPFVLLFFLQALVSASEAPPFGFSTPELYLSSFGSRALRVADLNQDGLQDLVALNNDKGRIDLYLQLAPGEKKPRGSQSLQPDRWNPVLDDARFHRSSIVTGGIMHDSLCGDFNGDGAIDLLVTDDQNRAMIFHGPAVPGWKVTQSLKLESLLPSFDNMVLDTSKREMIVLGKESIQTIRWAADTESYSTSILTALHAPGKANYLRLADVNGDGRQDLFYAINDSEFNLGIHLADGDGYSTVQLPLLDPPGTQFELKSETPFSLLSINPRSRVVQEHRMEERTGPDARLADGLEFRLLPFPQKGNREYEFRRADLDGNGDEELLARIPNEAEVHFVAHPDAQTGQPERFPIPAGCEWSLVGRFTSIKQDQILYCDTDRSYLGLSTFGNERLQYPLYVSNNVEWVSGATIPSGSERELDRLLAISKNDKVYTAHVYEIETSVDGTLALRESISLELEDIDRDPYAPQYLDLNRDGSHEFLVCSAFDVPFFLFIEGNELRRVNTAKGFSSGLLRKSRPSHFLSIPPGAGLPSTWLRLDGSIGQFLTLDPGGTVSIVDQINLRGEGKLGALLPLGEEKLALYNSSRNELEIHRRTSSGLLQFESEIKLPALSQESCELVRNKGNVELWVKGASVLARILPHPQRFRLSSSNLFETELEGVQHSVAAPGDFNGDGMMDLVALDPGRTHLFEFLRNDSDHWTSAMHFQVFEASQNFKGRRGGNLQPREFLVDDLNADQLDDLVLLVHDRILLYLQDPVPDTQP